MAETIGPMAAQIDQQQLEVPRDRDGSFEPVIVRKRRRSLDGIDEIVLSLTARRVTIGRSVRALRRGQLVG